jgi:ubiquinone/menaquinone biosynthesis C-methylase UbiE
MTSAHEHALHRKLPADVLDVINVVSMAIGRGPAARLVADLADVRDGDRVVDVGCGPGTALREAARRGGVGIGIDPSPRMRGLAALLTRWGARRTVTYLDGFAEAMPCDDASADIVWALSSAHHWTDRARALAEVHRVLRPGGRLLILERVELAGDARRGHHAITPR